jgi:hypothetical protein
MSKRKSNQDTRYHSKPELAERYRVSSRTIDRWRELEKFPPPDLVLPNGAPRWADDTITAHERALVGKPASAA